MSVLPVQRPEGGVGSPGIGVTDGCMRLVLGVEPWPSAPQLCFVLITQLAWGTVQSSLEPVSFSAEWKYKWLVAGRPI